MIRIEVSIGELFDKISILRLKVRYIQDSLKLSNINNELGLLLNVVESHKLQYILSTPEFDNLHTINAELWKTEDTIREQEEKNDFGAEFIKHARLDAYWNDKRFLAKRAINELAKSAVVEEKSYTEKTINREFNES